MSNKKMSKEEMQKARDICYKVSVVGCIVGSGAIFFGTSLVAIAIVGSLGAGVGYAALKKKEKLEEELKTLK